MFAHIRQDFDTHGRSLRERAFWAMLLYRFGRWGLARRFAPLRWLFGKVYGLFNVFAPILTGVAIDRNMLVGEEFHIVHPGMVVIHDRVRFGDRCGVMHGVTIGSAPGSAGVPQIGDDVFIGTGAVVIGNIKIGNGARIAANSLVVCDVPAGAMAIGVPAKIYPSYPARRCPSTPDAPEDSHCAEADAQA
jgi:serine O-acetyltransferase